MGNSKWNIFTLMLLLSISNPAFGESLLDELEKPDSTDKSITSTKTKAEVIDRELAKRELDVGTEAYRLKNYPLAMNSWLPLAEKGNLYAQYRLGLMFDHGIGVKKDYKKAFHWYKLSAHQGHPKALYFLAGLYVEGKGVLQDYNKAFKLYRLLANRGDKYSPYHLGLMFAKGQGVLQNFVEAHKWFNIAGANGDEDGIKGRNEIEKLLTPKQISQAQKLARNWMEKYSR